LLSSIGVIESFTISKGWQGPSKTGMSYLKDDWIPGDLGFDPLSLNPDKKTGFVSTYNEMSDEFKVRKRGTHTHTHTQASQNSQPSLSKHNGQRCEQTGDAHQGAEQWSLGHDLCGRNGA